MHSRVFRSVVTGRSTKAQLLAFALCGAFCLPAQADVIFSNITGTFSYSNEASVCTTPDLGCPFGTVGGGYIYQAAAFTPSANFTLTNVQVFVRGAECAPPGVPPTCRNNFYNLALYSDSNGLPGAAIASGSGAFAPEVPAVQTLNMGPVTLSSGTQYWLVMLPGPMTGNGSFTYWMGGGSTSIPAAFISYNAFTGQNGGSPVVHQPPMWLPRGTSTLQFEIDGVQGVQSPPSITCAATPNTLRPPNGKPVAVTVSGVVTPGTQPIAGGAAYAVADEYGQVQPNGTLALGAGGSYLFAVSLIAARNGNDQDGRTYTIVVGAKDVIGHLGSCSTVVTVPHDQGN